MSFLLIISLFVCLPVFYVFTLLYISWVSLLLFTPAFLDVYVVFTFITLREQNVIITPYDVCSSVTLLHKKYKCYHIPSKKYVFMELTFYETTSYYDYSLQGDSSHLKVSILFLYMFLLYTIPFKERVWMFPKKKTCKCTLGEAND